MYTDLHTCIHTVVIPNKHSTSTSSASRVAYCLLVGGGPLLVALISQGMVDRCVDPTPKPDAMQNTVEQSMMGPDMTYHVHLC